VMKQYESEKIGFQHDNSSLWFKRFCGFVLFYYTI
jgi:hypothetical protein